MSTPAATQMRRVRRRGVSFKAPPLPLGRWRVGSVDAPPLARRRAGSRDGRAGMPVTRDQGVAEINDEDLHVTVTRDRYTRPLHATVTRGRYTRP